MRSKWTKVIKFFSKINPLISNFSIILKKKGLTKDSQENFKMFVILNIRVLIWLSTIIYFEDIKEILQYFVATALTLSKVKLRLFNTKFKTSLIAALVEEPDLIYRIDLSQCIY